MKIGLLINEGYEYVLELFNKHKDKNIIITMLIDRNTSLKEEYINNIPKYSINYFLKNKKNDIDGVFIVTKQVDYVENDALKLFKEGIKNIYIPYPIVIEQQIDFFKNYKKNFSKKYIYKPTFKKPFIYRLETHSVDICNLNCNGCNNMTPINCYKKKPNPKEFSKDLKILSTMFENILIIGIQGGEPLLDIKRTLAFAKEARNYFPKSDIRVLTNGLLVPKTPNYFFKELAKLNITIHLSIYVPTEKILDKIISKFKENSINYFIAGKGKKDVFYKRLSLENNNDELLNNNICISTNIHYLRDGIIWKCPSSALVKNIDVHYNTKLYNKNGGINIRKEKNAWKIIDKLTNPCYLCKNCSVDKKVSFTWSNNKKHLLSEWII